MSDDPKTPAGGDGSPETTSPPAGHHKPSRAKRGPKPSPGLGFTGKFDHAAEADQ